MLIVLLVGDFLQKMQQAKIGSTPPPAPPPGLPLFNTPDEEPPNFRKLEWDDANASDIPLDECGFVWCFTRPEVMKAFIVVYGFPGVTFKCKQVTRTSVELRIKVQIPVAGLFYLSAITLFPVPTIQKSVPPKFIKMIVDIGKTIADTQDISYPDCQMKVVEVMVIDDVVKSHKHKFVI